MSTVIRTNEDGEIIRPVHVHISDVRTFRSCRQRWYFSSPMQMGLTTRMPSKALFLGTVCHDSLDRFHLIAGNLPKEQRLSYMQKCLRETWETELARMRKLLTAAELRDAALEINEVFDKAEAVLNNHVSWAQTWFFPRFQVETTEQDFVVPFIPEEGISYAGRLDAIAQHEVTGKMWLIDYKISAMSPEWYMQYLQTLDDQAKAYSWAGRQLYGDAFGGIAFIVVRSKPPSQPKQLKDGSFSRAQNQDTTWEIYSEAVKRSGGRLEAYYDVKQQLEERELKKPYNSMVMITFTDETLDRFEKSMKSAVREMLNPTIYPSPSFMNCRMCPFNEPCQMAMMYGSDSSVVNRVLAEKFVKGRYVQDAHELLDTMSEV